MRFETADALFGPLIARKLVQAQTAASQAVTDEVQLNVALTYLDLLRVYGALAINADMLARAEDILSKAAAADEQGVSRTKADVTRARTEVSLRQDDQVLTNAVMVIAGHDNDGRLRIALAEFVGQLNAADSGHADIGYY